MAFKSINPHNPSEVIGKFEEAGPYGVEIAVVRAREAFVEWREQRLHGDQGDLSFPLMLLAGARLVDGGGGARSRDEEASLQLRSVAERVRQGAIAVFPTKILLVTDGSKESAAAVRTAVELANGTGSELHVVHALSTAPKPPYPHYWERKRSNFLRDSERVAALALLDEELRQLEELGGMVAGSHYREGKPEEDVARLAEELEVGLIVIGSREVGRFGSILATSFSEAVYRRARCAVLVVRGPKA